MIGAGDQRGHRLIGRRHCGLCRQRGNVVIANVVEMVERGGIVLQKRRDLAMAKLADVGAHAQPMLARGKKYVFRALRAERAAIAENIHKARQLAFRRARDHLVADDAHVFALAAPVLARHYMRSEQRWRNRAGPLAGGIADGLQRLKFRVEVRPIAGLGFDCGRALRQHLAEGFEHVIGQRCARRFAHAFDAGADTASGLGDLLIGSAGNPLLEIRQPRRGKRRMSVGVDETGKNDFAGAVDLADLSTVLPDPGVAERVLGLAHGRNPAADAENRAAFDRP